jgi:small conductance mechanosensitive channel
VETTSNVGQVVDQLIAFGTTYGLKIIGAILILIVGRIVAGSVRGGVRRVMAARNVDPSLIGFVTNLVFIGIMIFTVLAALAKFGIQTASFVAVLGAAGFAIGFALQGSLSNFAAGVLLLVFRPFKVGDYVEAGGVAGSVKEIQIFNSVLATPDNVKITVPNGKIYGDVIRNYAGYETRRVDWPVGIAYDAPIGKAMDVILNILKSDERILGDPEPLVAVGELADSSVNLVVRGWAKGSDYWSLKFDLTRRIKEELDAAGIEIPFPQRVVHMRQAAEAKA